MLMLLGAVLVSILTFIALTFLGYISHWAFHQKWSGLFYRKHYTHHFVLYPIEDFVSDKYRNPKKDNSVFLFAIVFAPFVFTALFLTIFHIIPLLFGLIILGEMLIFSILNDQLHDAFHLNNSFWHRFWFFDRLKKLHFQHHIDTNSNFGIFNFAFDKILGTYKL